MLDVGGSMLIAPHAVMAGGVGTAKAAITGEPLPLTTAHEVRPSGVAAALVLVAL